MVVLFFYLIKLSLKRTLTNFTHLHSYPLDMKRTSRNVLVCPRCGSPDVEFDRSTPLIGAAELPAQYVCNTCGFQAHLFPEKDISQVKVRKVAAKVPKIDTNYGNFEVRVVWKYLSLLFLLGGVVLLFADPLVGAVYLLIGA